MAGAIPHLIAITAPGLAGDNGGYGDGKAKGSDGGVVNGANGNGGHWGRSVSASLLVPLAAPLLCDMATSSRR